MKTECQGRNGNPNFQITLRVSSEIADAIENKEYFRKYRVLNRFINIGVIAFSLCSIYDNSKGIWEKHKSCLSTAQTIESLITDNPIIALEKESYSQTQGKVDAFQKYPQRLTSDNIYENHFMLMKNSHEELFS